MKFKQDQVSEMNIAYIGGGSRGWAWKLMTDLALEPQLSGVVRLYDLDYDAAKRNEVIGNRVTQYDESKGKWQYQAVHTLEEALRGADFVIISILPGTFAEMASDVHLPEQYGIYQSVGDTVGPGGLMRALRSIPMFVEFAEQIRKHAPQAWVINYTNPLTLCLRTLYEVFPEIKAIGCCHGVFDTQQLLAHMAMETYGESEIKRAQVKINVLGINHFTWIDKATYKGKDLLPLFKQYSDKYFSEGLDITEDRSWQNEPMISANRVTFDMFRKYGLIPTTGDRHIAEFMPSWFYLKDPEAVMAWKFKLTKVDYRLKAKETLERRSIDLIEGKDQIELKASGEETVLQLKAMLGLGDLVTNINMPNFGQMKNIPYGAVVETNAYFTDDRVQPLTSGELPVEINNLVIRHIWNQETILKAALNKDRNLAFCAFMNDPLVSIPVDKAEELFNQMLKNTSHYLPGWD